MQVPATARQGMPQAFAAVHHSEPALGGWCPTGPSQAGAPEGL